MRYYPFTFAACHSVFIWFESIASSVVFYFKLLCFIFSFPWIWTYPDELPGYFCYQDHGFKKCFEPLGLKFAQLEQSYSEAEYTGQRALARFSNGDHILEMCT